VTLARDCTRVRYAHSRPQTRGVTCTTQAVQKHGVPRAVPVWPGRLVALDHHVWPRAAASDLHGDTSRQWGLCPVHRHGTDPTATLADASGAETRRFKDPMGRTVGRAGSRRMALCGVIRPTRRHQQVTMVVHRAHTWNRPHGDPCIRRRRCGNTTSPGRCGRGRALGRAGSRRVAPCGVIRPTR